MNTHYPSIFRRPTIVGLWIVAALTVSRLILVIFFSDRVLAWDGLGIIFGQGLRFDFILLGLLFALPMVALPWLHLNRQGRLIASWLIPIWLALASAGVFFVEAASIPFMQQFDTRPNFLFVEYLRYPREVLSTIWGMYPLALLAMTAAMLVIGWFVFRWLRRDPTREQPVSPKFCLLVTPLLLLLFVGMIRSTIQHRPVNPSVAAFSGDSMVNTLPLNSPYLVLYSIYELERDEEATKFRYGHMPDGDMVKIILKDAGIKPGMRMDPDIPSLHQHRATVRRDRPLNLVMIVMESVGAEHSSALGGRDLLPEFDSYADRSIWFENLYATGMRSARGLEAIVSAFPPSTAQAAIKAPQAQDDFFTIAEFLRRQGYDTSFLYGGASHFDNMRRFFLNNGFERVIDEHDFPNPVYRGSWGVSDEDLFNRAHEHFEALEGPFFSLVFTSSNHEPFDVPPGRVPPQKDREMPGYPLGRATAIHYSDWALGQFLEQARASSYWRDTVFLVVSDHNARTWGGNLVPIERFRIPGMILGHVIRPRRIPGITSQIDLVPTLLSIIGRSGPSPVVGRDITLPRWREGSGRAMMQFHGLQAYIREGEAVILQPDRNPLSVHILPDGEFEPYPKMSKKTRRTALAYAKWGPYLLQNRAYRLPETDVVAPASEP